MIRTFFIKGLMFASLAVAMYADEVVLIDQKAAIQGKVTAGDAPGFPVTITQPGSYRLAGNLTVPDLATTAIHIASDYVTLDLNGFVIQGPSDCATNPQCFGNGGGVGVHAGDFQQGTIAPRSVRVFNGIVRGMGFHGIRMQGEATTVDHVTVEGNGGPGVLARTVTDSTVRANAGYGVLATTVRDSTVSDNKNYGIVMQTAAPGGVISGNTVINNGVDGISAALGSTISGNSFNNNHGVGIRANCPSAIVGNTAVANQTGSIIAVGTCTVVNNAQ